MASSLISSKLQGQLSVYDDFPADLDNRLIDLSASLDLVGGRNAASKEISDALDTIYVLFRSAPIGACGC